ncbi:MAG: hypothetical protein Q8R45_08110 [Brevundimonas sp.]|uniref:hypothetical protein n=1 Tax=Brevundimonas sp. TaxID=1871086 RepID=UPI002736762F|nr:hypothetical protein [Brevundimonas sp.]MDP3656911.1 hypothetical protein [Brevundimonas sp.]
MLAVVFAMMLQQAVPAASGQVVWETAAPVQPAAVVAAVDVPAIPDSARADPYGYERGECSPLIRRADESMEACQTRVRVILAAHLGAALPAGLAPAGAPDACRQEAAGDRYALQCGAAPRADRPTAALEERSCETRPRAQPQGGVAWTEECRPASGAREDDGLRVRLGGKD